MGMFDDIQVEYPLPDLGTIPIEEQSFQTKSLACFMRFYTITYNGLLRCEDEIVDYHGDIFFYGHVKSDLDSPSDGGRREYLARFTEGKLSWIKVVGEE